MFYNAKTGYRSKGIILKIGVSNVAMLVIYFTYLRSFLKNSIDAEEFFKSY